MITENDIATKVIGCAIEIHTTLGAGLLESADCGCLFYDLVKSGFSVEKEKVRSSVLKNGIKRIIN